METENTPPTFLLARGSSICTHCFFSVPTRCFTIFCFFLHSLFFLYPLNLCHSFVAAAAATSRRGTPVIDGFVRLTPWKVVSYNGCTEIIYELVNDSLEFSVNNHTKLIFSLNSVISIFRIDQKKCKRNVCSSLAYLCFVCTSRAN